LTTDEGGRVRGSPETTGRVMELLALAALLAVAWLETARALGGKPLRNDIVMILTDGEGPGLLGASS
jgi:hypothetical protein